MSLRKVWAAFQHTLLKSKCWVLVSELKFSALTLTAFVSTIPKFKYSIFGVAGFQYAKWIVVIWVYSYFKDNIYWSFSDLPAIPESLHKYVMALFMNASNGTIILILTCSNTNKYNSEKNISWIFCKELKEYYVKQDIAVEGLLSALCFGKALGYNH